MLFYIIGTVSTVSVIGSALCLMSIKSKYDAPVYENIKQAPELLSSVIQLHYAIGKLIYTIVKY